VNFSVPFFSATLALALTASAVAPPAPHGVTPTPAQVKNAERAYDAFVHFTVTTFANREWGTGGESEMVFNPTRFDADQIITALKAGGAKGMILTCKHHDGFCLWPTKTTRHNISNSPFREGKGDMVREFADSCRKQGLDFGVYVSPWDRNNEHYGKPEYVTEVFQNLMKIYLESVGRGAVLNLNAPPRTRAASCMRTTWPASASSASTWRIRSRSISQPAPRSPPPTFAAMIRSTGLNAC
jgi:alpha-L-fucosidase